MVLEPLCRVLGLQGPSWDLGRFAGSFQSPSGDSPVPSTASPPSGNSTEPNTASKIPARPRDIHFFFFFSRFSPQKRSQPTEFIDPVANKKPRISHLAHRAQPTFNGKLNSANGKDAPAAALPPALPESVSSSSSLPVLELPRPHDPLADVSNDLTHNGRDCESSEQADRLSHPLPTDCPQTSKHNCGSPYVKSKKKSKKHKDKEKERKEKKGEEKCKEEKQDCEVIKNADLGSVPQDVTGTSVLGSPLWVAFVFL